jgi:IS30 family transposase
MTDLPQQLRKTLTWDGGKKLSGHAEFAIETDTMVYFADPHSPWQRPTNENTSVLLRQHFPKGTDLSGWSTEDLEAVALAINNRPRKSWTGTTAEVFSEQLRSLHDPGAATTGWTRPVHFAALPAHLALGGIAPAVETVGDA